MNKNTVIPMQGREPVEAITKNVLDEIVQLGAQRMLQAAIEAEVTEYIDKHTSQVDESQHRLVVRNGYLPERDLATGVGPLRIKQPRVRDKRPDHRFNSKILPPFLRRVPSVDALIPSLYLKGVSTNDFSEALEAILGPNAAGLSPANIVRLKEGWKQEYADWANRDLSNKRYVYWWADGIHFKVRLEKDRPCVLVLMGALADGTKELVAILDGHRESKISWMTMLRDLQRRGLKQGPSLAVGDGALGFWAALREAYPDTKEQRCWVHKTANTLDKMPKRVQVDAKKKLHEIYMAETLKQAEVAFAEFQTLYKAKYPKAVECLTKDADVLFSFYRFPAEHWAHLRTTNPIESTFATVRHRTRQTKGCGSRTATLSMVFKLCLAAEKQWRRLNGSKLIPLVIRGVAFEDGIMNKKAA